MKLTLRKSIGLAAALAMLAGPAMAQNGPSQHDQNHSQNYSQEHGQEHSQNHGPQNMHQPEQHQAYGPPHGSWHQGDHYNGGRQTVDWRQHHLHEPPSGYEWVQSGNQFVMIAVTTGIIASIIAGSAQ